MQWSDKGYICNVLNCGGGKCVHRTLNERCPTCGYRLVLVTTTGLKFCSNTFSICDYELEPDEDYNENTTTPN